MILHCLLLTRFPFFPKALGPHFQMRVGELGKGGVQVYPLRVVCVAQNQPGLAACTIQM